MDSQWTIVNLFQVSFTTGSFMFLVIIAPVQIIKLLSPQLVKTSCDKLFYAIEIKISSANDGLQ